MSSGRDMIAFGSDLAERQFISCTSPWCSSRLFVSRWFELVVNLCSKVLNSIANPTSTFLWARFSSAAPHRPRVPLLELHMDTSIATSLPSKPFFQPCTSHSTHLNKQKCGSYHSSGTWALRSASVSLPSPSVLPPPLPL